jgi:hypothetical protein
MIFAIPDPIPYQKYHFGIRYPYPPDLKKSAMDKLNQIPQGFHTEIILSVYTLPTR